MASGSATARRDVNDNDIQNRSSGFVNSNPLGGLMHPHNMSNGEFAVPNINMSTPPHSMNQSQQLPNNNGRPNNIPQHDGANDEVLTQVSNRHMSFDDMSTISEPLTVYKLSHAGH